MADNEVIFKPQTNQPYKNGTVIINTGGKSPNSAGAGSGNYQAGNHYVSNPVSASGEMDLARRFDDPDFFVRVL